MRLLLAAGCMRPAPMEQSTRPDADKPAAAAQAVPTPEATARGTDEPPAAAQAPGCASDADRGGRVPGRPMRGASCPPGDALIIWRMRGGSRLAPVGDGFDVTRRHT